MENNLIEGEIAYPIYIFSIRFTCDGETEKYTEYPKWLEGLPKDRIWNSTGFKKMFKEQKSQGWLDNFIMEWWDKYLKNKDNKKKHPKLLSLEAKLFEYETWFLTWFQHETIDSGQTDEEALRSFSNFVSRKQALNKAQQAIDGKDIYCLMGAEDRWRWKGAGIDGKPDSESNPPCRCKFCKEQGVLRIGH